MIPSRKQCQILFDRFKLPSEKRIHCETVAQLALYLAEHILHQQPQLTIDKKVLEAAALLHDIDHQIKPLPGERHPDTAVRVLKEHGFIETAEVVAKHGLHCILYPQSTPKTWEEKLLYLADKMVKYEIIGIEHRFGLWFKENLPQEVVDELKQALPKVKQLEQEILQAASITFADIQKEFSSSTN